MLQPVLWSNQSRLKKRKEKKGVFLTFDKVVVLRIPIRYWISVIIGGGRGSSSPWHLKISVNQVILFLFLYIKNEFTNVRSPSWEKKMAQLMNVMS